jgi:hypothetical protein
MQHQHKDDKQQFDTQALHKGRRQATTDQAVA